MGKVISIVGVLVQVLWKQSLLKGCLHKSFIEGVRSGQTCKGLKQGEGEIWEVWGFRRTVAAVWSRRELWSINCRAKFVPLTGKGAEWSYPTSADG